MIRVVYCNFLNLYGHYVLQYKSFLTYRSKISSDQRRLFFAVSPHPLLFFANTPFKWRVSLIIRDVLKMEEKDHVYTMKFIMIMEWYDFRINYFNLKGIYYFLSHFFGITNWWDALVFINLCSIAFFFSKI